RILISNIDFDSRSGNPVFQRGITTFEEKPNLLPFKEAKLYAHNSTHALAAYIGAVWGALRITDLKTAPGVSEFLEAALNEESGNALIRRHRGFGAIFTREGYRAYATDLLERMFNPYLGDTVDRVGRDPARKLEWDDRLVGTIRVGLQQGVTMRRYAMGAAAAVTQLNPSAFDPHLPLQKLLDPLWHAASPGPEEKRAVVDLMEEGRKKLRLWRDSGFPHLENFMRQTA
ncbi:MAG: hypothetical protein LAO30_22440, partial [Acidobacteriia bacterium]|nr:hypothetical protein [Terriglobia bacterium]